MHKNRKPIPVGSTFGQLTIIQDLGTDKNYRRKCIARCSCGMVKEYQFQKIKAGTTISCGCYQKANPPRKTHGESGSQLYKVFYAMQARCNNPQSSGYYKYGAKGITVCPEWDNYNAFTNWAKQSGYIEGLTIDRINAYGNYSPTNCRWVTPTIQSLNKPKSARNTSGSKNIGWHQNKQRWIVRTTVNGNRIHIGAFKTRVAAEYALHSYLCINDLTEHLRGQSYA